MWTGSSNVTLCWKQENEGEADGSAAEPAAPEPGEATGEAKPDEWFGQDLDTSRTAIEERLDTDLENVFPDDAAASPARGAVAEPAAYSEWSGVGAGGRDGEYNLEAYVTAEATLADHLAEQLALAVADPVRRMIGQHIVDLVDEAGYFTGDLSAIAEHWHPAGRGRDGAGRRPGVHRQACAPAISPSVSPFSSKERDRFDPAMQALVAHLELVAKRDFAALRKVCGVDEEDLVEMIGEIRHLNPKPGLAFGVGPGAADRAGRVRAARARRRLGGGAQFRHLAEGSDQPDLLFEDLEDGEEPGREGLSGRVPADRHLAHPRARSARPHHPQGGDRDRAATGRLLCSRRAPSATAQSTHGGRRHRDARIPPFRA